MPTYYLQEGLKEVPPHTERNTWSNKPSVFLDDHLHTVNKVEAALLDTFEATSWLHAREQINDWAYLDS